MNVSATRVTLAFRPPMKEISMTPGMWRTLLAQLVLSVAAGVCVGLLWPGGGDDTRINPTPPGDLGPGWLAGLIAGGVIFAATAITALVTSHRSEDLAVPHFELDLNRLAKNAIEDDARNRPSVGPRTPKARQTRTSAGHVPSHIFDTDGGAGGHSHSHGGDGASCN